jgi:hypothetical protein
VESRSSKVAFGQDDDAKRSDIHLDFENNNNNFQLSLLPSAYNSEAHDSCKEKVQYRLHLAS